MCTLKRPDLSYNELIRMALLSQPNNQASLAQIYDFIQTTYPFYNNPTECRFWKNSVRHNLCRNSRFMRVESNVVGKGSSYGRGHSCWQLCDSNTSSPQPRKKDRPARKRKHKANEISVRPSSVETSGGVYSSQYPWQPRLDASPGQGPSDCALDLSNPGQMSVSESDSLSHQAFLQPWASSNHLAPYYSHFEAPHPEELAFHTSDRVGNPQPLYPPVWFPEQDYSTNRGVLDHSVFSGYSDVMLDALRSGSPVLQSPVPSVSPHSPHLLPNQQCVYTDGLYYYTQLCPNQPVSMATSS